MRRKILFACLLLAIGAAGVIARPGTDNTLPSNRVPSGKVMYTQYCSSCHGMDAKGFGPYASMLKAPPANLTTLARRHDGKFPYDYVSNILRFGPGPTILHGSADMPAWGPIFQFLDKNNQRAVEERIRNLSNYLASLQE